MKNLGLLAAFAVYPLSAWSVGQPPVNLTFAELPTGTVVASQYAGATFTPGGFSGGSWATNTDMRVALEGSDLAPGPIDAGDKVLHTYTGWLAENGDPSFRITFPEGAIDINVIFSAVFSAAETAAATAIYAYNGSTLLGSRTAAASGTTSPSLSWTASLQTPMTSVVVTPGSRYDFVAVDSVFYTLVPEPASYGLMALGLAGLGLRRRLPG